MAQDDDIPAEIAEDALEFRPEALAHDSIEALTVIIDDPPSVAKPMLPAFEQRFKNIAFVHLGVAEKRDHPPFRLVYAEPLGTEVILHKRGEQGLRDAETDRARGEVHVVGVFGARGVGLRALKAAEVLEVIEALIAE